MQIIKAYDQTYCFKKTPNLQICCVLFKHVYYVIDVTKKKLQVSPVNKRYLAIDIHALISLNQKKSTLHLTVAECDIKTKQNVYITLCILRYRPESANFSKPSIDVQTFFHTVAIYNLILILFLFCFVFVFVFNQNYFISIRIIYNLVRLFDHWIGVNLI